MKNPSSTRNSIARNVRFDEPQKNIQENMDVEGAADFETAMYLSGHGKFNYMLLMVVLLATFGVSFDTSNTAYLLPSAECDLQMTHFDKGLLNAAVYLGMMGSAYMWGFIADTSGRHRLLIIGYALDTVCNLMASFAQSFWFLLVSKCIGGFITCGPMVVILPYLAEFHGLPHRAQAVLFQGVFTALAQFTVPVVAWFVISLPGEWTWMLFGMTMKFNSWRLYLLICSIPGLLAGICLYFFFDESPKFLMAAGRHEEALVVFRRIYTINTGNPPDTYPIKVLRDAVNEGNGILTLKGANQKSALELLKAGIKQAKPLFLFPLLPWALLVYSLMFGALLGMNTLRLWLPQLFSTMSDYAAYQTHRNMSAEGASLCDMLTFNQTDELNLNPADVDASMDCGVTTVQDSVYINSMIVAAVGAVGILSVSFVIKTIGKKNVLLYCFFIGGVTGLSIFWSRSVAVTLALSSIYLAMCSVCGVAVISVTVDLFPTSLRTMAISLVLMAGELGATIGNMLFPILLDLSCILPFFLLGGVILVCGALSLLLPGPKKELVFK